MPGSRWALAGLLLAFLAAFLVYTARLTREPPPRDGAVEALPPPLPANPPPSGPGAPPRPAVPVQFTHSAQCRDCHREIYREWQRDQHATSWSGPKYMTFTENYSRLECLSCHAPQPMLEIGVRNEPKVRAAFRGDGVDCIACHVKKGRVYGTRGGHGACGGQREALLKTSQACYHCHHTHNLFKEYLASDYYKRGVTCQDCHMEKVRRPLARGGPPRWTRRHFIHGGGHDLEGLKKALALKLAVKGRQLTVTVINIGAAHGVPGEINNRIVRLEISVLVKRTEPLGGRLTVVEDEVRAYQETFQAPPRLARNIIPSTQIMPGQPRVLTYELPVEHGKVAASLSYKLEHTTLNAEAAPMVKRELKF